MPETTTEAPPTHQLRDGRSVVIRRLVAEDSAALLAFGAALPADDRLYLQNDIGAAEVVTRLVNARDAEHWQQLVAVAPTGAIAGYASARLLGGWSSHVADIQLLIDVSWRRIGLGTALAREIVAAARGMGATKVMADMVEEQADGQSIFTHLGFRHEGRLVNHSRDRDGNRHSLVVLGYSFSSDAPTTR
jgi:ribosomal protein S18 acetylase RimI-like enzyme